jgi:hypothetical protein
MDGARPAAAEVERHLAHPSGEVHFPAAGIAQAHHQQLRRSRRQFGLGTPDRVCFGEAHHRLACPGLQAESTDADATELEVRLGGAKLDVEIEIGTRTEPDRGRGRGAAMTDAHATRLSQCLGAQRESRGAGIEPRHGCHTIGIVSEAKRVEDARRCRHELRVPPVYWMVVASRDSP